MLARQDLIKLAHKLSVPASMSRMLGDDKVGKTNDLPLTPKGKNFNGVKTLIEDHLALGAVKGVAAAVLVGVEHLERGLDAVFKGGLHQLMVDDLFRLAKEGL